MFDCSGEIVYYTDEKSLIECVDYYIERAMERSAIAQQAQQRAYRDHTMDQRVDALLRRVALL